MKKIVCISTITAMMLLSACGKQPEAEIKAAPQAQPTPQETAAQLPTGHPQLANVSQESVSQGTLIGGVVEEVLAGGGYTYVMVKVDGKEQWAAAPMTSVSVGQKLAWEINAPMKNFHSSSLNRTFETVYFVSHFNMPGMMAQQADPNAAHAGMAMGSATPQAAVSNGEVLEVFASAGYTYLRVNNGSQEQWLAVPETTMAQGSKISWNGGSEMKNFTSRSLDKTFDSIWFIDKIEQIN
jgi:hypothetical protein